MYEAMSAVKNATESSVYYYTSQNRSIIDSGDSTACFTRKLDLTNPKPQSSILRTVTGSNFSTTHEEKILIENGKTPIYLPAFVAPQFGDNLISVEQLAKKNDVTFPKGTCL